MSEHKSLWANLTKMIVMYFKNVIRLKKERLKIHTSATKHASLPGNITLLRSNEIRFKINNFESIKNL